MPLELRELLRKSLSDPETGWSMGSFGAIAEFHQDADEPVALDMPHRLTRATARGAIRIHLQALPQIVPVAYETPSPKPHRWSHGVALCIPAEAAHCNRRSVLTELGPDIAAIRPDDARSMLFDMGLALPQCDFCIRTSDPELLAALRDSVGCSLFEAGNPAMPAILQKHPHRVAATSLGRVEVTQKIGGPETGGVSPRGPHTHVLPKLLRSGRTHSANQPIPEGLTPCVYFYPGNPVIGPLGEDRPFSAALHDDFQAVLRAFGPADLVDTKARVIRAVERGEEPGALVIPDERHHRAAVRVALRQLARWHASGDRKRSNLVGRWRERFDQAPEPGGDGSEDN